MDLYPGLLSFQLKINNIIETEITKVLRKTPYHGYKDGLWLLKAPIIIATVNDITDKYGWLLKNKVSNFILLIFILLEIYSQGLLYHLYP